jgi:hypothetical protein
MNFHQKQSMPSIGQKRHGSIGIGESIPSLHGLTVVAEGNIRQRDL